MCHRPYEPFVDGIRATHERLYRVAAGEVRPFAEAAEEIPRVGF